MQQPKLFILMASILKAWSLKEERRSEEICANQPESGRLDEGAKAAEQESPSQPPEPLPS